MSDLSDDSREADEREEARRLRDLRARIDRARAIVATRPGLAETLATDWQQAARFYARFGITEAMLRSGVPPVSAVDQQDPLAWSPDRTQPKPD